MIDNVLYDLWVPIHEPFLRTFLILFSTLFYIWQNLNATQLLNGCCVTFKFTISWRVGQRMFLKMVGHCECGR